MKTKCFKTLAIALLSFASLMIFAGCYDNTFEWDSDTDQQNFQYDGSILLDSYPGNVGNFMTFWTSNGAVNPTTMNLNGTNDSYTSSCSNMKGGSVVGIGWTRTNDNSGRLIHFTGKFHSNYGGAFGVYGWTTNPDVEYYICEKVADVEGPHNSAENRSNDKDYDNSDVLGTYYSDGSMYKIYSHYRDGFPWIYDSSENGGHFMQFISVRQTPRTTGTITVANHIQAWARTRRKPSNGSNDLMTLGSFNSHDLAYQVLFTEFWNAQDSNGDTLDQPRCAGESYGKLMPHHVRALRMKNYIETTKYLAVNNLNSCVAGTNGSIPASDWLICSSDYNNGSMSNEVFLMSAKNGKYVKVNNNHAYATETNSDNATRFITGVYGNSYFFRYGNSSTYLTYEGNITTANNKCLFTLIFEDNRD